jgi:hypothetical protein
MIPGYLSGAVRGKPESVPYQWRARTYPGAVAAIEQAEAEHGPPVPTCLHCGGRMRFGRGYPLGECEACGVASAEEPRNEIPAPAPDGPAWLADLREVIGLLAGLMGET